VNRPRLGTGDTLVVNASDAAMRQGSTTKVALLAFAKAGVRVYGVGRLHAKVMVFGDRVVVGSSNLSMRASQGISIEAAVVSDSKVLVREANAFIDGLIAGFQPISLEQISALPDVEPRKRAAPEALDPPERLWVYWPYDHEFVETGTRAGARRARRPRTRTTP